MTDSIVESVINQFKQRSEVGINKYGTTLDRNDLSTLEWIEHAKQEAMDFTQKIFDYIVKLFIFFLFYCMKFYKK